MCGSALHCVEFTSEFYFEATITFDSATPACHVKIPHNHKPKYLKAIAFHHRVIEHVPTKSGWLSHQQQHLVTKNDFQFECSAF